HFPPLPSLPTRRSSDLDGEAEVRVRGLLLPDLDSVEVGRDLRRRGAVRVRANVVRKDAGDALAPPRPRFLRGQTRPLLGDGFEAHFGGFPLEIRPDLAEAGVRIDLAAVDGIGEEGGGEGLRDRADLELRALIGSGAREGDLVAVDAGR